MEPPSSGSGAPGAVLAVTFGATELWLLLAVSALLLLLVFLAVAETAINRISRVKAKALERLVEEPERFLNPVLLTVNIAQTVQTVLVAVLAERVFGGWGVVVAT